MTIEVEMARRPLQLASAPAAVGQGGTVGTAREPDGVHGTARGRVGWSEHRRARRRGVAWGLAAAGALVLVYLGVLALAGSLEHALGELFELWAWMTALVAGFGVQVGLFAYARTAARGPRGARAGGVAASGGTSTLSMVACCAHHLTDVLPAIGVAGAAVLLATYQSLFLLLGVLSNLVGLVYVLGIIRRHRLFPAGKSLLSLGVRWPVDRALPWALVAAVIVFTAGVVVSVS